MCMRVPVRACVLLKAGGRGKGDAPGFTIRTLAFALRWGNQCRVWSSD